MISGKHAPQQYTTERQGLTPVAVRAGAAGRARRGDDHKTQCEFTHLAAHSTPQSAEPSSPLANGAS